MKATLTRIAILGAAITPAFALAVNEALTNLEDMVQTLGNIIQTLLPIVFALAILAFFYGIFQYIFSGSGEGKASARHVMLWSLVAIFVMASLYGIIALAQRTLGINNPTGTFEVPKVQGL